MNEFETNLNSLLVDTFNNIMRYEQKSLKAISDASVTVNEAHILEAIGDQSAAGATVSVIAGVMGVTPPTATVAVKKLESKGFVTKRPSADDGRISIVSLTPLGERIYKSHKLFHSKMVRNISGGFSENEQEALLALVKRLREFFKEKVEKQ